MYIDIQKKYEHVHNFREMRKHERNSAIKREDKMLLRRRVN